MSKTILEVKCLTKNYGSLGAVDGISFSIEEGEIFGLLGPNGAGKTTTINMLTGLAKPSSGSIYFFGQDYTFQIKKAQHLMGIVPDENNLYPELTGFENLCFCGALYGMRKKEREEKAEELLEIFGLSEAKDKKFAAYSRGMKRRLTIACGIIHNPPIIFLDEPTTGIDVSSARQIRRLLMEMNKKGTTIFLTTHYIEEAERLCSRVAFIVNGKIIRIDSVNELIRPVKDKKILTLTVSNPSKEMARRIASILSGFKCIALSNGEIRLESNEPIRTGHIIHLLEGQGIEIMEAKMAKSTLEDVFVEITGIEAVSMKSDKEKKEGQG